MRQGSLCRLQTSAALALCTLAGLANGQVLVPVSVGPDVIVGDLPNASNYVPNATNDVGFDAYAIGTTSCNKGDLPFNWYSSGGGDNRHPVIGQNLFRLNSGRFEQIGQAWLKHGFTALQGTVCANTDGFSQVACSTNPNGQKLGVGCSDPYSSGLNGSQSGLGPKWQVDASRGLFPQGFPTPTIPTGGSEVAGRLRVRSTDVTAGSTYWVEGQYIAGDDASSGYDTNNASYRACTVDSATLGLTGPTIREKPAIYAWQVADPTVTISTVDLANDGLYILGCKVTSNGGSPATWTYEYALYNFNSHQSANRFTVPKQNGGVTVSAVGFHDVDYHSGEPNAVNPANPAVDDWSFNISNTAVQWTGPIHAGSVPVYTMDPVIPFKVTSMTPGTGNDHSANALRWATLFNFRFTATVAPASGRVEVGMFRPGTRSSFTMNIQTPGGAVVGTAPTGSCCIGQTCSITTQTACGGTFRQVDGACTPNPCAEPARGACCQQIGANQVCRFSTQASCAVSFPSSSYLGDGSTCQPSPCATIGACCIGATCTSTTQAACSGTWTSSVGCTSNPCSGSCCIGTACTVTTPAACTGSYTATGTCTPNPCAGACCALDTTCSITNPASCVGNFRGTGTTCTPSPCVGPVNDSCAQALGVCPGTPVTGTTINAVDDGNALCANSANSPDVWYFYIPATSGNVVADLCTASYDCALSIWTGECPGTLQVACDDDSCGNLRSSLTFAATAGTRYLVRVSGYNLNTGTFTLTLTSTTGCNNTPPTGTCCTAGVCTVTTQVACAATWTSGGVCTPNPCAQTTGACCNAGNCTVTTAAACGSNWTLAGTCAVNTCPPLTDDCANRAGVGLGTTPFNTTYATTDGPTHTLCLGSGDSNVGKDIWFNYPAGFTGTLDVDTCGSTFDTKVAVYDGFGCLDFNARILACNDDNSTPPPLGCGSAGNLQSFLTINVVAGTSYTIRVGGYTTGGTTNTASGAGQLTLTAHPVPTGSCCAVNGTCSVTVQASCATTWTSGGSCTPNICTPPTGACCCGSTCSITLPAACTGTNRAFAGGGTVCTPFSSTAPCCRGDYNKSGGANSVQDIFDFLGGYFSGDSCADANDSGGANSPQDIFDFLAAYFNGC